jgi:DNA topoisomerase-1
LRGSQITEAGWISFYKPYTKFERVDLPPLKEGMSAKFTSVRAIEKFTQPPPRYNASSLLREMETNEIGTKATRADIVETLHRRAYVRGERIEATPLGTQIVEVLQEYCPKVLDVQFTRELEEMMTRIELGKEEKDEVVSQVVSHLKPIMDELKAHENNIGGKISLTIRQMRSREATLSSSCPKCGRKLVVVRSKRSGKRFIGCLGKWDGACTFTLPLPQFGVLTLLDRKCTKCGFQLVSVSTTDKRPFVTCPMCYVDKSQ